MFEIIHIFFPVLDLFFQKVDLFLCLEVVIRYIELHQNILRIGGLSLEAVDFIVFRYLVIDIRSYLLQILFALIAAQCKYFSVDNNLCIRLCRHVTLPSSFLQLLKQLSTISIISGS